jgi:ribosomal protein L37E
MTSPDSNITCPLCGTRYNETEGQTCHSGCPLQRSCQLLSCPACGYEVPAPTRVTRWLSRWLGKQASSQ